MCTSRSKTSRSSSNCLARGEEAALLVEQHRRAVEDELVLATHEVHVEDRHGRVRGARRQHRLALTDTSGVVWRRVDVDDELGATRGLCEHRSARAPRVLADRDGDAHAADDEQRAVDRRGLEVALLVEHGIVRQQVFPVHPEDAAVRGDRRGVVQVAVGFGKADDRGHPSGARRELLERLLGLGHEGRPEEEILGRVAGDRQLGKGNEVAIEGVGTLVGIQQARRVALEVPDDEVELGCGDTESCHHQRIRPNPARRPRRAGPAQRSR